MTLAAARARARTLRTAEEDRQRLAQAHREVVRRLIAVSPRIAIDGPVRAWVEPIGRDAAWCARVRTALAGVGPIAVGLGPTATVAWAAACAVNDGHREVDGAEARAFLDERPLEVLEIGGEALDVLAALGLRRVGELRAFDAGSLGMRFGPAVAEARRRLDDADVRRPTTPRLEDDATVRVSLDDELDALGPLAFLLGPACDRVAATLRARALGAVHLSLALELRGGREHTVDVRTASPLADGRAALELLRNELDRVRLAAPIAAFRLGAPATAPLRPEPATLFGGRGRDDAAREVALARLRTRFGDDRVVQAAPVRVGPDLLRARWRAAEGPRIPPAGAMPWRRLDPPARVAHGFAQVAGRCRRIVRMGRVERASPPWWEDGRRRVHLVAWAEMDGPLLVMLRAVCDSACDDVWEVVAWVD